MATSKLLVSSYLRRRVGLVQTIKTYLGIEVQPLIFDLCTRYRRVDKSLLLQPYSQGKCPWLPFKRNMGKPRPLLNFGRLGVLYTPLRIEPLFLSCVDHKTQ